MTAADAYLDMLDAAADERADMAREEGHEPTLPRHDPGPRLRILPAIGEDGCDKDGWAWRP